MKFHHKRMRNLLHDISFDLRVIQLIRPDDEIFLECLHCEYLVVIFLLGHVYFAKGAPANDLHKMEVLYGQCVVRIASTQDIASRRGLERRLETRLGVVQERVRALSAIVD